MISQARAGRTRKIGLAAAMAAMMAMPQIAQAQEAVLKGMISGRSGDTLTVRQGDGSSITVKVDDETKVVAISGKLGLQKNDRSKADLITGLPISIEPTPGSSGGTLTASTITFKQSDVKTANQIAAGTAELQAENEELRGRMANANQYAEKGSATILFASGSTAISADGKADLDALATKAKSVKGYLISVVGYADKTGNADANQKLSARRAQAVIRYLQKNTDLVPQRVMAGDAMGDVKQVGDTSTAQGLAQNRRVEVKILTNKGLEGL